MKRYQILLFFACCLLYSCPPRSTQQGDINREQADTVKVDQDGICDTDAMVKDFTGMDGCRFLFVLDNEEKLLPSEMPLMDFKLANNQKVKIGYSVVKDGLSACMMESQIIKVNCIELIGQTGGVKPVKKACVKVDNYTESKWLKRLVGDMDPYMITRFNYLTDGWAYLVDNGREKKLIDCQGTEICSMRGKALNACSEKVKSLGKGTTIYATKPPRND